ncbi:hypothetical protein HPP92_013620 [Vanilla planifolia]|uniref:Uncharacterized protein n=1 Tax=Vanilla planifolia TaxID=51239 RepID=A0A835QQD9_VANPL|nr:hypothetical protein HPP92_013620 [Vanilla planifolia]
MSRRVGRGRRPVGRFGHSLGWVVALAGVVGLGSQFMSSVVQTDSLEPKQALKTLFLPRLPSAAAVSARAAAKPDPEFGPASQIRARVPPGSSTSTNHRDQRRPTPDHTNPRPVTATSADPRQPAPTRARWP